MTLGWLQPGRHVEALAAHREVSLEASDCGCDPGNCAYPPIYRCESLFPTTLAAMPVSPAAPDPEPSSSQIHPGPAPTRSPWTRLFATRLHWAAAARKNAILCDDLMRLPLSRGRFCWPPTFTEDPSTCPLPPPRALCTPPSERPR